jgi:RNA polymerase primary sigma factor
MVNYPHYNNLSYDEERELAGRANKGDKSARELLILSNIAFAIFYSRKFSGYHLEEDDLIQAAITGLVIAADKFDAGKKYKFITYARFWIRNEIQDDIYRRTKTPANNFSDLSLDEDFDEDEYISSFCDNALGHVEDDCIDGEVCAYVQKAVSSLGEKEADIIARHYGFNNAEPETLSEIAESYGLTKSRIHQIEKSALCTLQDSLEDLSA